MAASTTGLSFFCLLVLLGQSARILSVRLNDADKAFLHDSEGGGRVEEATQGNGVDIEVWVESATGLHDYDGEGWANGKADPFVVVILDGHPPWTTSTKEATLLPIWHEQNTFPNYDCASHPDIHFKVYDHDDEANDMLGEATLAGKDFMYKKMSDFSLQLKFENGSIITNSTVSVKVNLLGGNNKEHPCGSPPSEAQVEGGIKEGDMVEVKVDEGANQGRKGVVVKKDVHGDEEGESEVRVKFDDGKEPEEDWFEEGDVELVKNPDTQVPEQEDLDEDEDVAEDVYKQPEARTGSPDHESSNEDSDLKPESCRDWTEEHLPKDWAQVESRRRKGKMVWKNKKRKLRVASVKRACEYETGILKWH